MADRGSGTGTERQRLKKLAQAALNADVTVGQVDSVLSGLGETLSDLNKSTAGLDQSLDHLNETLTHLDETIARLASIVDRVEPIVGIGETVMSPIVATETAVRGVVNAVRERARR